MDFGARVAFCRENLDELDRNGLAHTVGQPLTAEPLPWYPQPMARAHRLFDGLTARLLWFHPYAELTRGLSASKPVDELVLGTVCHSFSVRLETATSRLSIWDVEDLTTPEEWDDDEEPEPVFTVGDPLEFFDEYVFGSRYPDLIDDILDYGRILGPDHVDEWRQLLRRID